MNLLNNMNSAIMGAFSITVLIMIRIGVRQSVDLDKRLTRLMGWLIWSMVVAIGVDTATWVLDGAGGQVARTFISLMNSLDFLLIPVPPIMWYIVTVYLGLHDRAFVRWRVTALKCTFAANALLVALNPFLHLLFRVDEYNCYRGGPLEFVSYALPYGFLLLSVLAVYRYRAEYSLDVMASQHFWLPPLIAGGLQMAFPTMTLTMPAMAFCALALYNSLLARSTRLDYLTGVHTRRYLDALLHLRVRERAFSAIMVDVDQFKLINDRYGHIIGDEVLIGVASALKMSVRKNDCVARLGGDEFVLVIDSPDPEVLEVVKRRISLLLAQFNEASAYPFVVSLSMGCGFSRPEERLTAAQVITRVDRLMYQEKAEKPLELGMK